MRHLKKSWFDPGHLGQVVQFQLIYRHGLFQAITKEKICATLWTRGEIEIIDAKPKNAFRQDIEYSRLTLTPEYRIVDSVWPKDKPKNPKETPSFTTGVMIKDIDCPVAINDVSSMD